MDIKKILLFPVLLCVVSGCHKEPKEPTPPPIVYTTLADLAQTAVTASTEFDIHIKDLVVSGVYENYVQLEDGTAGALFSKTGHNFSIGQVYNGHITGKYRVSSGALSFSDLNAGEATITQTTEIPCLTVPLSEILQDKVKFYNRRVRLQNITFVNGFKGKAGGAGTFSQKGVQMSATCRPAGLAIEDGSQGDLICFPSSGTCYVMDTTDFVRHEISTPLTEKSVYGVYSVNGDTVREEIVYTPLEEQYSFSVGDENMEFSIQSFSKQWVLTYSYPIKIKVGQVIRITASSLGKISAPCNEFSAEIVKVKGNHIWLMDYESNMGYVMYYE